MRFAPAKVGRLAHQLEYTPCGAVYRRVRSLLKKYDNDVILVAEKLDIGKSTIYRYLKEMKEINFE